jgi:hypothetical protein
MKLTETEKAYLAGFIDGEGSFIINKREHQQKSDGSVYIGYSAYVDIGNTNKKVLNWIKNKTGATSKIYMNQMGGNRKIAYRLRISCKQAHDLIREIRRFLIIKKECAQVFSKYPLSKRKRDTSMREILFQKMKRLNHRGL